MISLNRKPGRVAVLGEFDGLHIGHQRLVDVGHQMCRPGESACALVLDRGDAERHLLTLDERLDGLEGAGVESSVVIDATVSSAALDHQLGEAIELLSVRTVVLACAPGDPVDLRWSSVRPMLHRRGVEIIEVPRVRDGVGRVVTSSLVRERLAAGAVDEVRSLIGRPVTIVGTVEHGDERGRTIGFPTANLPFHPRAVWPALGVYAAWVTVEGRRMKSAVNIGTRPTVYGDDGVTLLEAHVLDFSGDLYGRRIGVELIARLRAEHRFASLDELKAQLARDIEETSRRLHSTV